MLQLKIPLGTEQWDAVNEQFIEPEYYLLDLEHSLVSVSKWESKWCKPFLSNKQLTYEETIDYVKCMSRNQHVPPDVYNHLTDDNVEAVTKYIANPMTATFFSEEEKAVGKKKIVTSELVYYWMFSLSIPKECEKWHLNRLMTLIRVFNAENKSTSGKKPSKRATANKYAAMNAARRKKMNTKG